MGKSMFPVQGPQLAQNGPEVQKRAGLGEEMSREEEGREHSRPQSFPGVVLSSSLSGGPLPLGNMGQGLKAWPPRLQGTTGNRTCSVTPQRCLRPHSECGKVYRTNNSVSQQISKGNKEGQRNNGSEGTYQSNIMCGPSGILIQTN